MGRRDLKHNTRAFMEERLARIIHEPAVGPMFGGVIDAFRGGAGAARGKSAIADAMSEPPACVGPSRRTPLPRDGIWVVGAGVRS
jgi:hypothetical protein